MSDDVVQLTGDAGPLQIACLQGLAGESVEAALVPLEFARCFCESR